MVILRSVTAGGSSMLVWRDEETKISSGSIHKKNITHIFDGKQQRNASIFKELGKWCLPGLFWLRFELWIRFLLLTIRPLFIFFHLKFTPRLMETWQMTAQMQNKRLLDCSDKDAYGLFMSRCVCLRALFQRRTLQWTVDAHRFTPSVMFLQRHMADHQKCIHSNVSCEGFLVNILKWTLAHASGRAERMNEFLVFKEKKKIASVLKLFTSFFLIVARSSPYISLLETHSSFYHIGDQSVKPDETKWD